MLLCDVAAPTSRRHRLPHPLRQRHRLRPLPVAHLRHQPSVAGTRDYPDQLPASMHNGGSAHRVGPPPCPATWPFGYISRQPCRHSHGCPPGRRGGRRHGHHGHRARRSGRLPGQLRLRRGRLRIQLQRSADRLCTRGPPRRLSHGDGRAAAGHGQHHERVEHRPGATCRTAPATRFSQGRPRRR